MFTIKVWAVTILMSLVAEQAIGSSRNPEDSVLAPIAHTRFCLQYPNECEGRHGEKPFVVTRERLSELEDVNFGVNVSIKPMLFPLPIDVDRWLINPLDGNCGDYAVTKRHYLLQRGWPSHRLLLAEVVLDNQEHHLILIAKTEKSAFVLDNLRWNVPSLAAVRKEYRWVRIETPENPKFWTKSLSALI